MGNEVIFGKITTGWGLVARETDHVITRLEIKSSPTLSTSISEAGRLNQTPMVSDWINHLYTKSSVQFSCSVMSDSLQPHGLQHAQASLSITNSQNLLKLLSIESVMPSNHLIFCHPLLLPPSIFPSIRVFSNESYTRKPPFKKKKMMVVGNLLGLWACGGAGRVARCGEHGRSMPLPTRLALVSLSSGCFRVVSFYDQPVI